MKKRIFPKCITIAAAFAWTISAHGQYDKRIGKLQAKISQDSTKLVKYESMISSYEEQKGETAAAAQASANDNKKAAGRLTDDPQNKRLARQANKAASNAAKDSKKARLAAEKLDRLNRNIKQLNEQLANESAKMGKYKSQVHDQEN